MLTTKHTRAHCILPFGHKIKKGAISTPYVEWLRARLEDSKILWVRLPIFLHNTQHGAKVLVIDPARIHDCLDVSPEAVKKLTESFIYPKERDKPTEAGHGCS